MKGDNMDSKEQALEKALKCAGSLIEDSDSSVPIRHDKDNNRFTVHTYGPEYDEQFPYAPPREAPAKGTICVSKNGLLVGFSEGSLTESGNLYVNPRSDYEGAHMTMTDWRVVGEQGDLVRTETVANQDGTCRFGDCKYACTHAWDHEPCKGCMTKTTTPTNYKAKE
jgi:hypothetical protein